MNEKIEEFAKVVKLFNPAIVNYFEDKTLFRRKKRWEMGFYDDNSNAWAILLDGEKELMEARKRIGPIAPLVNNDNFI